MLSSQHLRSAGLGLAACALLGWPAPRVHATSLTLNSGDSATVDVTGTHGTISGNPVSNGNTTYADTGVAGSSAVMTTGTSSFNLGNGGTLAATSTSSAGLGDFGSGPITITGGVLTASGTRDYGLFDNGSGPITITGGDFTATGYQGYGLFDKGNGPVTISDAVITATGYGGYGLYDIGDDTVTVTSGVITATGAGGIGLASLGGDTVIVAGGVISSTSGMGLDTEGGAIDLFSMGDSPFLVDGKPMNNTSLPTSVFGISGTISGTLLNGDSINTTFRNGGTINLNIGTPPALPAPAVPEPSSMALLGLGLLPLAGLALRARRRMA